MTKFKPQKIFLVLFIVWVGIWLNFTIRDLTKKKYFAEYKTLLSRDTAGKISYTYGDRFFEFLKFSLASVPAGASYELAGVETGSVDYRRAVYYLYPHFEEKEAQYILIFDKSGYEKDGYVTFKTLDPSTFILKRAK